MLKKFISGILIAGLVVTSCGFGFGTTAFASSGNGAGASLVKERNAVKVVQKAPAKASPIYYSNLTDKKSRDKLKSLMTKAGIGKKRQNILFAHIDQFNNAIPKKMLTKGMEKYIPGKAKYDPYDMGDAWEKKYQIYMGQNCRLTAFTTLGGYIDVKNKKIIRDDFLAMDKMSAADDPWVKQRKIKDKWWLKNFARTYSTVPTKSTKNVKTHVAVLKNDWKKRGVTFKKNNTASLISVVMHDNFTGRNELNIGHTGVLFKDGKDLWFLEKLAFQEPYQFTKFKSRVQLNNYLMRKYDTAFNQKTAAPFLMENANLMAGYKRLK